MIAPTWTDYQSHGWQLCAIPPGTKGPTTPGWNSAGAEAIPEGWGAGLLHSLSGTAAIDIDDLEQSRGWLMFNGVDLDQLLSDPSAVHIVSGRPNRDKLLFKTWMPLPSKKVIVNEVTLFELRCASRDGASVQDVLPGSIHPDTGRPYEWKGDWRNLPDLPEPIRSLWERLIEEEGQAGGAKPSDGLPVPSLEEIRDALSRIPADCNRKTWIECGMGLHDARPGDEGFALWNEWSSNGEEKYKLREMAGQWRSFKDRDDGIGIATLFHHATAHGWRKQSKLSEGAGSKFTPVEPEKEKENDLPEWDNAAQSGGPADRDPLPPCDLKPFPGIMRDLFDAALPLSYKEQPELMMLAILSGMAASINGRYYHGNNNRCNLYVLGVVGTGEGKDWPLSVGRTIAREVGARIIDVPASGEGLEDSLTDHGNLLMGADEIGHMFAATHAKNAQSHLISLLRQFLRLFSASRSFLDTRSKSGLPGRRIAHPCLNILGFSTPAVLGSAMQGHDVSTGELPRYLTMFGRDGAAQRRIKAKLTLPPSVKFAIQSIRAATEYAEKDNDGYIPIAIGPAADEALDRTMAHYAIAPEGSSEFAKVLWSRAYEKCERVAAVLAVWAKPTAPSIEPEMIEWAQKFVDYSNASVLHFVDRHMVGAKSIADANRIMETIHKLLDLAKAGKVRTRNKNEAHILGKGLLPWTILLTRSKLDAKDFAVAMDYLIQTERVEKQSFSFKICNPLTPQNLLQRQCFVVKVL